MKFSDLTVAQYKKIAGTPAITTVSYTHTDHLGGSSVMTNTSGTVQVSRDYHPYGETRVDVVIDPNYDIKYQFTGQEKDQDAGYYYYNARYYSPEVGRFLSVDPVARTTSQSEYFIDPQQWNNYAYARNNPILFNDPTGESITTKDVENAVFFVGDALTIGAFSNAFQSVGDASARMAKEGVNISTVSNTVTQLVVGVADVVSGALATGEVLGGAAVGASKLGVTITQKEITKGVAGKYSNVPNPKNTGPGKAFGKQQKANILEANRNRNGGELKSDISGENLTQPQQHKKGITPPSNEAHIDHVVPKSKGGANTSDNAQVLSRKENLEKSNKIK